MKAIFSPGPSFHDPKVREFAGWVRILDLYKEALLELGFEVFVPQVPPELIDGSSTVSKITSYDLVAASQLPNDADLFLGPPGYSLAQIMKLKGRRLRYVKVSDPRCYIPLEAPVIFLFVFNNSDEWRDQQLAPEYKRFNQPYDLSETWRWINRKAIQLADHIIAPSPFVKGTWAKVVPQDRISIAFWGVDSQMFTPAPEEPPGFRVLFVGGDPVRKGLIYLLEAWDVFSRKNPEARLTIAGCNIRADVFIDVLGLVPHMQMPELMRRHHVLVLPTLEDGIALCVQEAMASGVVPVATEDPAEVFKDGVSGVKIPYRGSQAIKDALTMLHDDPQRRREMARAARALAENQPWFMTKEQVKDIIRKECIG